jgi:hypothetical protein
LYDVSGSEDACSKRDRAPGGVFKDSECYSKHASGEEQRTFQHVIELSQL